MLDQYPSIVYVSQLIGWALKIYSWIHIAAFLLSWIQADLNNPLVSGINRATIPMWNWVGKKLPRAMAAFAPILALMLVLFGEIVVPGIIRSFGAVMVGSLDFAGGGKIVVLYILFGALYIASSIIWFVFILAILWFIFTLVNPPVNNPIIRAIWFLIDPLLTPIQRILPRGRMDFSPLVLALLAFLARDLVYRIMIPIQLELLI